MISEGRNLGEHPPPITGHHVMDSLRQDLFDATASRQGLQCPGEVATIFDRKWVSGRGALLSDNRLFQVNQRGRKNPLHARIRLFAFGCAQCDRQVRSAYIRVNDGCDPSVLWKWRQIVATPQEIGVTTAARVLEALTIHDEPDGIAHFERVSAKKRLHAKLIIVFSYPYRVLFLTGSSRVASLILTFVSPVRQTTIGVTRLGA
jgi:hypothetical protein